MNNCGVEKLASRKSHKLQLQVRAPLSGLGGGWRPAHRNPYARLTYEVLHNADI